MGYLYFWGNTEAVSDFGERFMSLKVAAVEEKAIKQYSAGAGSG